MTTTDPTGSAEAQVRRLDESIGGLRAQLSELVQAEARDQREVALIEQRLRELEGRSITMAAEIGTIARQTDEVHSLRERIGRFASDLDGHAETVDTSLRQMRLDTDAQRDAANETDRRMTAEEKAVADLRERINVQDEVMRRFGTEMGETAHRIAQMENTQQALGARISANTEGVRRAASNTSLVETRLEAVEREQFHLAERMEVSQQSLRRVEETAEQWDDLRTAVDSLRSRVEETLSQLDASKLLVASVQRGFEAVEGRIGDVERVSEQIRLRDARRERDISSLGDRMESLTAEAAQDQDKFVALQEQIRRRQIEELEQEIRELKSFLRVRGEEQQ